MGQENGHMKDGGSGSVLPEEREKEDAETHEALLGSQHESA
jgi:hypothetical protein